MEPKILSFQTFGHKYLEGAITLSTSLEKYWRFFFFFREELIQFSKRQGKAASGLRDEGEDIRSMIWGVI